MIFKNYIEFAEKYAFLTKKITDLRNSIGITFIKY